MSPAIIEPDCVIELDTITLMKGELCLAVQSYYIRLREARHDEVLPGLTRYKNQSGEAHEQQRQQQGIE